MKTTAKISAASLVAAAFISLSTAVSGQVTVTETSTTGYGTITTYSPGQTLVVNQESGSPINYTVTRQTTFVDEAGVPVEAALITAGVPITVSYVREGDRMIASRVIVKKTVTTAPVATQTTRTTTTTTTGAGTVTEFSPGQTIVLRSTSGPLTYATSSSTVYVDEAGSPVAVEKIAPGAPVTVHYVQEGNRMIANRVVVTRTVTGRPLTKDEREDLKEQREEARERRKEAREEAKERREELREELKDD